MRKHPIRLGLLLVAVAAVFVSCQNSIVDVIPVAPDGPVSFSQDVHPILVRSCGGFGCHINESINGVNLTNYLQVTNSIGYQYGEKIVIPGDAAGSPLVDKLKAHPKHGAHMPPGGRQVSAAELGIIMAWIDDGAKNN